ncbi:Ubiquitin-conjugating enzyme E2 T [Rhizoclosmatium sp. JEL0117]|nr:Ubiquitin-conjugating enzyme E2 T [Rhizoclosmatium sp. JEL0117]
MTNNIALTRIKREASLLQTEPAFGVTAWPDESNMHIFHAEIEGPEGSPYERGCYQLVAQLTDRYPFEPPKVVFKTKLYHPNIDSSGRICSDVLKMPPQGCWSPKMNLNTVFAAIRLLMAEPNPDDPLEKEIADEYKTNRQLYIQKAKAMTQQYAVKKTTMADMQVFASESTGPKDLAVAAEPMTTNAINDAPAIEATEDKIPTNPQIETASSSSSASISTDKVIPQPLNLGSKKRTGGLSLSSKSKKPK